MFPPVVPKLSLEPVSGGCVCQEREFFIGNLLVRVHFIIVMIRRRVYFIIVDTGVRGHSQDVFSIEPTFATTAGG